MQYDVLTYDQLVYEASKSPDSKRPDIHLLPASGELIVDTTVQDVQTQGLTTIQPVVAGALSVVSDSAQDSFGGTGASLVVVNALDESLGNGGIAHGAGPNDPWSTQIFLMNGIAPATRITTGGPWLRALVALTGPAGATAPAQPFNIGTITVAIGGVTLLVIPPAAGISKSTWQTVPRGWHGVLSGLFVDWEASSAVTLNCKGMIPGSTVISSLSADFETSITFPFAPQAVPETASVWCTAFRSGGPLEKLGVQGVIPIYRMRS